MTNFKTLLLFCLLLGATLAGNAQTIRYVKMDGTGSGSSWTNASDDLQAMINLSQAGDEIWVAEGVYVPRYTADGYDSENGIYPDYNGDMNDAFVLKSGLKIYGGFVPAELGSGTITAPAFGAAGRNGITILDGDNRCFHVVISAGLEANTLLDGLTISGGNGTRLFSMEITVNGEVIDPTFGSGIYIENSSPTLTNVTISRNFSIERGGGIYINNSSSPRLVNVTISSNRSDRDSGSGSGGGMYIGDNSSPTLVNVTISGNNAYSGGGIFIDSSSPTLVNVTISSNRSAIGGGMYNYSSSTEINNSIIWGNKAGAGENNIYYQGSNIPVFNHSLVEGLTGPGIILNTNPLFENWIDPESAPNTLGDYRLKAGSPAIDVGNNSLYLTARGIADFNGETDLAGNPRLAGGTIDLGAYEYPAPPLQGTISITGTTTYGEMLTANTSGITSAAPLGALSYKWKRSGSDISGANGNTYTLVAGDIGNAITLEVSAAYYSGSLTSTPTAAVGKKGITFTGTVSATKVYDGNANFTNAQITVNSAGSFSDLVGSDVVTLNKTGVTGTYGPNAGTGTLARSGNFSIIGANAGNYTLLAQPIVTATITPASRAVQWGNRSFTYTGSAQAPTASITGVGSVGV
ncbi:MAG: YDG domain-containing protein, partial [Bacteroidales bacterium]|nr:YDG domain-containing protein [Bacteroidales bacterium]